MNLTPMGGKEEEEADYFQSGFHDKTETNGKVLLLALLQLYLKERNLYFGVKVCRISFCALMKK